MVRYLSIWILEYSRDLTDTYQGTDVIHKKIKRTPFILRVHISFMSCCETNRIYWNRGVNFIQRRQRGVEFKALHYSQSLQDDHGVFERLTYRSKRFQSF
jgi:hypothetical protein